MKFLSVCSGIEAASVAWNPLGWKAVGFSEIEPFPCAVLAHHYPDVPNYGDLTKWKEWGIERGTVDVVCGGTPCQSFSVAGLRKGLDDERGNLMLVYLKLVEHVRPRYIVWENVPGVLSSNGGRDFGTFLGGLGQLGYGWAFRVLDAQYVRVDGFGRAVPQRRRRVFVVGCLGGWQRAASVLFERDCLSGHPAPRREAGKGFAGTTRSGSKVGSHWDGEGVHPSLTQSHNTGGIGQSNQELFSQRGCGLVGISSGSNPDTMATLCACDDKKFGSNQWVKEGKAVLCCAEASPCMTAGGKGFAEDGEPSFTLTKGHGHAVAVGVGGADVGYSLRATPSHSGDKGDGGLNCSLAVAAMSVRRLTPIECERLMGFPDNYTRIPYRNKTAENCPDGPRYKALGNSWAVNCARWVGTRIQMVEGTTK